MTEIIFERKIADEIIIDKAVEVLKNGGIIVVPTDTIPGIGCRADDIDSIKRLFKLKDRPEDLPIPVILADTPDIKKYAAKIPRLFHKLAERYWPGALTVVLESNGAIDPIVGGGKNTLGFRIPDLSLLRGIVRAINVPLALTSANPHSVGTSAMHERLLNWWKNKADLIILGRSTAPRPASAVVDLVSKPPCLLREGLIDSEELNNLLS